jgi:hypothetical protein
LALKTEEKNLREDYRLVLFFSFPRIVQTLFVLVDETNCSQEKLCTF